MVLGSQNKKKEKEKEKKPKKQRRDLVVAMLLEENGKEKMSEFLQLESWDLEWAILMVDMQKGAKFFIQWDQLLNQRN